MTLSDQKKLAKHICRLLRVTEITFPIARTHKGNLGLAFNVNNDDYVMMLDSVPLSVDNSIEDDNNIELKKMIEKYMFDEEVKGFEWSGSIKAENAPATPMHVIPMASEPSYDVDAEGKKVLSDTITITAKKRGRPAGTKNVKPSK